MADEKPRKKMAVPQYFPVEPPKKEINELLSQETVEAQAHSNMRSYAQGKLGVYGPYDEADCTRPDLYKEEEGEKDEDGDEY